MSAGLPDFSWYDIPKREKYSTMAIKYTKGRKMYLMATIYIR
jgi:hypothetical protein